MSKKKLLEIFRDYYEHQIFEFFWEIVTHKNVVIEGYSIDYIELPLKMFEKGSASVLYRRTLGKVMIFIPTRYRYKRYVIFHEFVEGMVHKSEMTVGDIMSYVMEYVPIIAEFFGFNWELFSDEEKSSFSNLVQKWAQGQEAHAVATIEEIELAKDEMTKEEFQKFAHYLVANNNFYLID